MATLDTIIPFAGIAGEIAVVALLLYRRVWQKFPWFCAYSVLLPIDGVVSYVVFHYFPKAYFNTYLTGTIVSSLFQYCVLVEVVWSVFRPFRASLPKYTVWFFAGILAAAGAAIWPFAKNPAFAHIPAQYYAQWDVLGRFMQTDSALRVLFFLALAACSQLLSIGWRDRELQIATGLGFYSLVALGVSALDAYTGGLRHFSELDYMRQASYLGCLAYWVFSFAQKEAERRAFSPQMQGMLLAVAGAARSSRIGLTSSSQGKSRSDRDL